MKTRAASRLYRYTAGFILSATLAGLFLIGCVATESTKKADAAPDEDDIEVGYGTLDKGHVVGAVATVDGNDVQKEQPRNLAEMLRGRTAGVQVIELPGGGIRVRIRGTRSFMGGNEPLYVIDGVAIQTADGSLFGISPGDVESISVLKDASATAIYGSRGANGVVLVKTKRGTK